MSQHHSLPSAWMPWRINLTALAIEHVDKSYRFPLKPLQRTDAQIVALQDVARHESAQIIGKLALALADLFPASAEPARFTDDDALRAYVSERSEIARELSARRREDRGQARQDRIAARREAKIAAAGR